MTTLSQAASPAAPSNVPEFSVSEISQALKRTVESEFGHVRVRGEISGFKQAASGHLYMTLKDEQAVLDAVCWRGTAGRLSVRPEDGLEIIATGRLTTYPGRSKYQIVIESVELAGEGALLKLLEERRKKLAAEGLFDADRKQPLPFLPQVIGVVTSPTGAVIRDILHRLADRFPRHVLLWPVLVQGEGAAVQVASAISGFNALAPDGPVPRPDLLIVARGGGSLEDLWAFNEEAVVRAAAASTIPLISAVGHETDTTLIDHAADRRAPTPTAAAEMAVPVRAELLAQVTDDSRRLIGAMHRLVEERRLRLDGLGRGLPDPRTVIETGAQRLDDRVERLGNAIRGWLRQKGQQLANAGSRVQRRTLDEQIGRGRERSHDLALRLGQQVDRRLADAGRRLDAAGALLNSLSYERVLERGFTLVQAADGTPVTSVAKATPGTEVTIRFHDGSAPAEIAGAPARPRPRQKRKPEPEPDDSQGTLL
jgi:exodeoxyribonuclease VII large subunit